VISGELLASIGAAVAARKGHDPDNRLVVDERLIEIGDGWNGEFDHHPLALRKIVERANKFFAQDRFGIRLGGALDRHLRFYDRNKSVTENLPTHIKLLLHYRSDPGPVKRGIGVAQAIWYRNSSRDSHCEVRITHDGSVELLSGVQDIGSGIRTVLAQVVAEELGLKPADITIKIGTRRTPTAQAPVAV